VKLDSDCADYRDLMLHHPFMQEWKTASQSEEEELEELDVEF
jgi:hypothetical protein